MLWRYLNLNRVSTFLGKDQIEENKKSEIRNTPHSLIDSSTHQPEESEDRIRDSEETLETSKPFLSNRS